MQLGTDVAVAAGTEGLGPFGTGEVAVGDAARFRLPRIWIDVPENGGA